MAHQITYAELLGMQQDDLQKELRAQETLVRKMRIGIAMNKEKDTAKYRREKKILARMHTAQVQKHASALKSPAQSITVPARKTTKPASSARRKPAPK